MKFFRGKSADKLRSEPPQPEPISAPAPLKVTAPFELKAESRRELIRIARAAMIAAVDTLEGDLEALVAGAERSDPMLAEPRGVFVTVYVDGQLRGCLGEILPSRSTAATVARCASRACVADHRFAPLTSHELPRTTFKISLLSPTAAVARIEEIQIGRDGLIVTGEGRCGLLLPEVALESGWDHKLYLEHLWRKAGLSPQVPLESVALHRFTTLLIRSDEERDEAPDES